MNNPTTSDPLVLQPMIAEVLSRSAGSGVRLRHRGFVFEIRRHARGGLAVEIAVRRERGRTRYFVGSAYGSAGAAEAICEWTNDIYSRASALAELEN